MSLAGLIAGIFKGVVNTHVVDVDPTKTHVAIQLPPEAQQAPGKLDVTFRIKIDGNKPADVTFDLKDVALLQSLTVVPAEGSGGGSFVSSTGGSCIMINGVSLTGNNDTMRGGGVLVRCGDVGGNVISRQGDIHVSGNVQGKAESRQGSIRCGNVGESASSRQGSIHVSGNVGGECTSKQGSIHCGSNNRKRKASVVDVEDEPKAKRTKE